MCWPSGLVDTTAIRGARCPSASLCAMLPGWAAVFLLGHLRGLLSWRSKAFVPVPGRPTGSTVGAEHRCDTLSSGLRICQSPQGLINIACLSNPVSCSIINPAMLWRPRISVSPSPPTEAFFNFWIAWDFCVTCSLAPEVTVRCFPDGHSLSENQPLLPASHRMGTG